MIDKEKMAAKPSGKTEHRTLFGVMLVMIIVLVAATMFTLAGIEKTMPAVLQQDPDYSHIDATRSSRQGLRTIFYRAERFED